MSGAQTYSGMAVPARLAARPARRAQKAATTFIPFLFILSLLFPYRIEAGPFLLSPNRIFLILILIPCLIAVISGKAGRLRIADAMIAAHAIWMGLAFVVAHGPADGIEAGGIYFIEVMGSYLVARCFIRSPEAFYSVVRILFSIVIVMLPLLVIEAMSGKHVLNRFLALFGPAITPHYMEPRMGLDRAFGAFDHPILLGVFCISSISLAYYVLSFRSPRLIAYLRTGLVAIATATSLSAGPLLAMVVQFSFIGWEHVTRWLKYRWQILAGMVAIMYVVVDLISNRTPFHVVVSHLTFNTGNAYTRILAWQFGTAEVRRSPLFGIGLNEWERPPWMSTSMDNFWLVLAVHGGLPSFLFFAGTVIAMCYSVGRRRFTDPRLISYRYGWMITILGLSIAGATVHYWKVIFCLIIFLIASGAWLLEVPNRRRAAPAHAPASGKPARGTIPLG